MRNTRPFQSHSTGPPLPTPPSRFLYPCTCCLRPRQRLKERLLKLQRTPKAPPNTQGFPKIPLRLPRASKTDSRGQEVFRKLAEDIRKKNSAASPCACMYGCVRVDARAPDPAPASNLAASCIPAWAWLRSRQITTILPVVCCIRRESQYARLRIFET